LWLGTALAVQSTFPESRHLFSLHRQPYCLDGKQARLVNTMSIRRVVPNIQTERMDESRKFYTELLGLEVAMDMSWIVTLVSPSNPTAQISLVRGTAPPAPHALSLSVEVADVDAIHTRAVACDVPIVYPLTTEPWGVRRFHVTDPNGVVINVMSHHK
jgi:predicted enzyme related to lactoylglutathione lyase